jgi:hypothetical protein
MAGNHATRQQFFGHWQNVPAWARGLARAGYAAKAVIYFLIGAIALYEAIRQRSAQSSPTQAMHLLRDQTFGILFLSVLAAGMICYGGHRCIEAVLGPVTTKSRILECFHRLGRVTGGLAYLGFAALAVSYIWRNHSGNSNGPMLAGKAMHYPFGNSFLIALGAILAIVGVLYFFDALSGRYRRSYKLPKTTRGLRPAVQMGAIYGICSRGLFFLLCGGLVVYSGLASDPSKARGMQGVLALIQKLPFGQWLFGLISIGLIAYGLFCVVRAVFGTYPSDVGV